MALFDAANMFCTKAEIQAYAGPYVFSANTIPTETEVDQYARNICGEIVMATVRAGLRINPPASAIVDVAVREVMIAANAIGAAQKAVRQMALGERNNAAHKLADELKEEYIVYLGNRHTGGTTTGLITETIVAISSASTIIGIIASDVIDGIVTMDEPTATGVKIPFGTEDLE